MDSFKIDLKTSIVEIQIYNVFTWAKGVFVETKKKIGMWSSILENMFTLLLLGLIYQVNGQYNEVYLNGAANTDITCSDSCVCWLKNIN